MNTELISRADAEALFRTARNKLNPSDYKTADEFNTRDLMLLNAEQMIHLLPSVTPKQRTGHWIVLSPTDMYCSECNEIEHLDTSRRFCAYCGTKMSENPTGSEPQENEVSDADSN